MNNPFFNWLDRVIQKQSTWIGLFALMLILCVGLPLLLTSRSCIPNFGFDETTGWVGDSIGGIATPTLAFFGIILTFLAFYIQFKANQIQIKANAMQQQNVKDEWLEKVLISHLESHERLKADLNDDGGFKEALKSFVNKIQSYSKHYKERNFNALIQYNPDNCLNVDDILLSEYFNSIRNFIDLIEWEKQHESKERKDFYVQNFIYRKLQLSERFLIGYYLERELSKERLGNQIGAYEEIFKDYYLKTEYHLKRGQKLAPELKLKFAYATSDVEIKLSSASVTGKCIITVHQIGITGFKITKLYFAVIMDTVLDEMITPIAANILVANQEITVTPDTPGIIDLSSAITTYLKNMYLHKFPVFPTAFRKTMFAFTCLVQDENGLDYDYHFHLRVENYGLERDYYKIKLTFFTRA